LSHSLASSRAPIPAGHSSDGAAVARLRYRPGWLLCGAALLVVCGVNGIIHGITALHNPSFFGSEAIYDNLTFWGWFFVAWAQRRWWSGNSWREDGGGR
jgi:hypothetical protein